MTRAEREQTMFNAECMRLHIRGRMEAWQRDVQAKQALRKGLDDSVVWMELVETAPLVNWGEGSVAHTPATQAEQDVQRRMMMAAGVGDGEAES